MPGNRHLRCRRNSLSESERGGANNELFSFSNYFRCVKCGSVGPWDVADRSALALIQWRKKSDPDFQGLMAGARAVFDGTLTQTAAMGEDYLLSLLEKEPSSSFLLTRMGSLFRGKAVLTPRRLL